MMSELKRFAPYWMPAEAEANSLQSDDAFPAVEVAAMMMHGFSRNGDEYLCSMYNSVVSHFGERYARKNAVVFAPQMNFPGCADDELYWGWEMAEPTSWAWGGNSSDELSASISSFQILDEMLLALANRTRFPNLKSVVLVGHSGGGQTLQRYALANMVHETLVEAGLSVQYVPANPSSMTYLSNERPVLPVAPACGSMCSNVSIATRTYDFQSLPSGGGSSCDEYDTFGYGLQGRKSPYVENVGIEQMRAQFGLRNVTYLSGSSDVCNGVYQHQNECEASCTIDDGGLDQQCGALAQGWCRMERTHAYFQHVRRFYKDGSLHRLVEVPDVGHNGCAMIQSQEAREALFGRRPTEVSV
jgi:hypothetical protein